jgi:hypothetical protein
VNGKSLEQRIDDPAESPRAASDEALRSNFLLRARELHIRDTH